MKAISIRQPWASLIVRGIKDIENRTWPTPYTGPLLIHASKTWDRAGHYYLTRDPKGPKMDVPPIECHSLGSIIGKVDIVNCVKRSESKWFIGPWGFVLENPVEFDKPIPYKGALNFFYVPGELII